MATPDKPNSLSEAENGDMQTQVGGHEKGTIEYERAQLLANLPDPDAGKSDEERREIVSYSVSSHVPPTRADANWTPPSRTRN